MIDDRGFLQVKARAGETGLCFGRFSPPFSSILPARFTPRRSPQIIAKRKIACRSELPKIEKNLKIFFERLLNLIVVNAEGDFEDRRDEFISAHCFSPPIFLNLS